MKHLLVACDPIIERAEVRQVEKSAGKTPAGVFYLEEGKKTRVSLQSLRIT